MNRKWIVFLLILGTYALLTSISVYPAFKYWNSHLIGRAPDAEQNGWNFWWIDRSFQQGYLLPYHTELLYYPRGVQPGLSHFRSIQWIFKSLITEIVPDQHSRLVQCAGCVGVHGRLAIGLFPCKIRHR